MDPRRLDLRRQLAYHRHGWAPPGSQGSSGSVTPSRRGPLVARASLLRGGVSDVRKKEDALVKIRDAEAMYRLVNASPVPFDNTIRPQLDQARRLVSELRNVPASDDFEQPDVRFEELNQAATALKKSLLSALAAGRQARINYIETQVGDTLAELEEVEPFESEDQDEIVTRLSTDCAAIHDDIEHITMGCNHASDEELIGETTEAARLRAKGRVLVMQMNRHHVHLAEALRRRQPARRSASPRAERRGSESGPSHGNRRDRHENSLFKHQHVPQLSQRQSFLHGISERELLGRYGYTKTADGRQPSSYC